MTIYEYVAAKNPIGAKNVLNSFGEKAVPRPDILARQLANCVNKHGKNALYRIAAVHPDLKLVSEYHKESTKNEHTPCECDKCKMMDKEQIFSSADGQEVKKTIEDIKNKQAEMLNAPKESTKSDSKELMIVGAVVIIALALVMKK